MTNLEIAQQAILRNITEVAVDARLSLEQFEPLGYYKAKLTYPATHSLSEAKRGKLVLVTAISPTPSGEGKTTVTIGLAQGLRKIGKNAIPATREPALGPIFGVKGGACGGGYSQVLPMEDINLFFTGDFPAIAAAHNLLSALLDAHIQNGNELEIDTRSVTWPRTLDMNDRALREIVVGLGKGNGVAREDGFVITPASEVMAILCLATSVADLREKLGSIVVGKNKNKKPVRARDLKANGAMAALLGSAIRPNLVQTIEGGPAVVHGGPFGNIAHGCSSIIATTSTLGLAEYTVTEAGFGSDLGAEKFLNIVCPRLGQGPDAIVLVATIRALEHHGSGDLEVGFGNLRRHIQHLKNYGPPVVVAINRRAEDSLLDHDRVIELCSQLGVTAITSNPWSGGGEGCEELATEVDRLCELEGSSFQPLYAPEMPIEEKLQAIVTKAYGGVGFELSDSAGKALHWLNRNGFGNLPVCVAKTQYSLSDNPKATNAPEGFTIQVRDLRLSAGAGFIVALCGDIMLMPGLGKSPTAFLIDIDDEGKISGLF